MEKYVRVPVIDVHKENLDEIWPLLLRAIYESRFVALDTELSGLGERKKLFAKSIEDRYKNLVEVAKSRSILALGISCFQESTDGMNSNPSEGNSSDKNYNIEYQVCTFNLSVLCSQEFVVEPASLQFLIQHGFDFNKQFSKGVLYHKGEDKEPCDYAIASVRNLFAHILACNKPVVFHNGLLDLVFLYQNLYSDLPDKLEVFTSDVHGMFTAGVFDTKYIAEFKQREPASYLSYIFRKCQRYNTKTQKHIKVAFPTETISSQWIEHLCCHEPPRQLDETSGVQICELYAAHGFCRRGADCHLSHDIDQILDKQDKMLSKKKRKNKKRKTDRDEDETPSKKQSHGNSPIEQKDININTSDNNAVAYDTPEISTLSNNNTAGGHRVGINDVNMNISDNDAVAHDTPQISRNNVTTGGHRAGIDAFMTGYCLATYILLHGKHDLSNSVHGYSNLSNSELVNKMSLSGKEVPLTLACSHFAKPSLLHINKMKNIKVKMCQIRSQNVDYNLEISKTKM
ncbi:target of EGR1 protein 1 isoform X2 [Exaiptasia diaphana]|uniref:Target of EGR1 protein 1 n=1 Tax=Exaiptasia diaphana TaxID=2652724 RepID=A0A913X2G7_EXADI|nr:target of EGR1 protein 1 isoform X2 [Exaiptasia diaphana]